MNDTVKKLADQALDTAVSYTWTKLDYNQIQELLTCHAKLIIGECMRMCDVAAIGYESHGHMKEANGCYSAKEYIEEHFGVEE